MGEALEAWNPVHLHSTGALDVRTSDGGKVPAFQVPYQPSSAFDFYTLFPSFPVLECKMIIIPQPILQSNA